DGELVRYNISRTAVIIEKGQKTLIAPYDRQFESKSVGSRTMTIFAGPLFNFILAFFIFMAIGLLQGVPTMEPIITEVQTTGSAYEAGMQNGDLIKKVDNKDITTW
ncbi:site-2 protease family protein, partial [Microvirga sp. 3-52]|nr:site-2 protease family protein [Microvirga sp. 3-52]